MLNNDPTGTLFSQGIAVVKPRLLHRTSSWIHRRMMKRGMEKRRQSGVDDRLGGPGDRLLASQTCWLAFVWPINDG